MLAVESKLVILDVSAPALLNAKLYVPLAIELGVEATAVSVIFALPDWLIANDPPPLKPVPAVMVIVESLTVGIVGLLVKSVYEPLNRDGLLVRSL